MDWLVDGRRLPIYNLRKLTVKYGNCLDGFTHDRQELGRDTGLKSRLVSKGADELSKFYRHCPKSVNEHLEDHARGNPTTHAGRPKDLPEEESKDTRLTDESTCLSREEIEHIRWPLTERIYPRGTMFISPYFDIDRCAVGRFNFYS